MAIKHLSPRTKEEVWDKLTTREKHSFEAKQRKQPYKKYPMGYKTMRVLEMILNGKNITKSVLTFLYELSYGKGSYDAFNSGYWSEATGLWECINKTQSLWIKENDGISRSAYFYTINEIGMVKLEKYKQKFQNLNIESYI